MARRLARLHRAARCQPTWGRPEEPEEPEEGERGMEAAATAVARRLLLASCGCPP